MRLSQRSLIAFVTWAGVAAPHALLAADATSPARAAASVPVPIEPRHAGAKTATPAKDPRRSTAPAASGKASAKAHLGALAQPPSAVPAAASAQSASPAATGPRLAAVGTRGTLPGSDLLAPAPGTPASTGPQVAAALGDGATKGAAAAPVGAAPAGSPRLDVMVDACRKIFQRRTLPLQQLAARLPDAQRAKLTPPFPAILAAKFADCQETAKARAHVEAITEAIGSYSPKAGVILPFNNFANDMKAGILGGMEERFRKSGHANADRLVARESMGGVASLEQRLAELYFLERVGLVVHYGSRAEQDALAQWSSQLLLPVVNLGLNRQDKALHAHAFYVWPNDTRLAETLARYARQRRWQRVAILRPTRQAGGQFIYQFTQALAKAGIDATQQYAYAPTNFASMEAALRSLFKMGREGREAEFQELFEKKKAEAEAAGLPLTGQEILLPPRVDVDAVYVGDNFRNVRHLVKIMKSLGVRSLTLLGNQEWRAQDLIDPPEPFLEGSVFVDVIGSYQNLPAGLAAGAAGAAFFVPPAESQRIDLRIIGYQAAAAVEAAFASGERKRHRLREALAAAPAGGGYFGPGPMFDAKQQAQWPSFLLQVGNKRLDLVSLPPPSAEHAAAAAAASP